MAERELRIRAIADVAQAKAQLGALSAQEAQADKLKGQMIEAKLDRDLLKLQVDQARAVGKNREEVQKLEIAYRRSAAAARVVTAESKLFVEIAGKTPSATPSAPGSSIKSPNRSYKALSQLGISGAAFEGGALNPAVLTATIVAAIVTGFKTILQEQRQDQSEIAAKTAADVGGQNDLAQKARSMGVNEADLKDIINRTQTKIGVANTQQLQAAALQGLDDGGAMGAFAAINKAAAGEKPITKEQSLQRFVKVSERAQEVQGFSEELKKTSTEGALSERLAVSKRQALSAAGEISVGGRIAAFGGSVFGASEETQLNAITNFNSIPPELLALIPIVGSFLGATANDKLRAVPVHNITRRLGE
jgi:hypothetical protein